MSNLKTYRGRSLEEVLPQIKAEMGPDALVVAQRDAHEGGVGGFFARRMIEVDVQVGDPMHPTFDTSVGESHDERVARFTEQLEAALSTGKQPAAPAQMPAVSEQVDEFPMDEDHFEPTPLAVGPAAYAPPAAPAPRPPAPKPAMAVSTDAALPADAHEAIDALTASGLSHELAADLVDQAVNHLMPFAATNDVKPVVARALAQRIPVRPVGGHNGHVIGFVGPGGSGKTRCVAQLAAAYARGSSLPVACVALRAVDGGAELGRLLAPFGVPMHALEDPHEAAERVAELRASTLVVLDTPGVSPRAQATVRELAGDLRRLEPDEVHLTLPATYGPHAARELLEGLAPLRPDALALTHADETGHLGTAIELAIQTGTPLSFVSRGAGALRPAAAEELALAITA
jgi:flagellar biosynthesis protein FlhF